MHTDISFTLLFPIAHHSPKAYISVIEACFQVLPPATAACPDEAVLAIVKVSGVLRCPVSHTLASGRLLFARPRSPSLQGVCFSARRRAAL
jgi:hypothetical protein